MLEWKDLLDGDLPTGGLVEGGDDSSVCTFTEAMEELVIIA